MRLHNIGLKLVPNLHISKVLTRLIFLHHRLQIGAGLDYGRFGVVLVKFVGLCWDFVHLVVVGEL